MVPFVFWKIYLQSYFHIQIIFHWASQNNLPPLTLFANQHLILTTNLYLAVVAAMHITHGIRNLERARLSSRYLFAQVGIGTDSLKYHEGPAPGQN